MSHPLLKGTKVQEDWPPQHKRAYLPTLNTIIKRREREQLSGTDCPIQVVLAEPGRASVVLQQSSAKLKP